MNDTRRIRFHEGSIALPTGFEDRTTNLFIPEDPQRQPNLSIARDTTEPDEQLPAYVERQIGLLKKRLPGYRVVGQRDAWLGAVTDDALAGRVVDAQHKSGSTMVFQRQAVFEVAPARVLVFTLSHSRPFDAGTEALWSGWLGAFRHPDAQAPSTGDGA